MRSNAKKQLSPSTDKRTEHVSQWVGVGRAIGGAIIFSLPMMMTMEMWQLGFYMSPVRLICLILVSLPLFCGISAMVGFRNSKTFYDNAIDVLVAYALTFVATGVVLTIFGIISLDTRPEKILSMLLLQAVPGSLGALLARNVVAQRSAQTEQDERSYKNDLTVLAAGALFLAFNLAPTEEMVLISYTMTTWHSLVLMTFTLLVMHAFAIASSNATAPDLTRWSTHRQVFLRITCMGYMLAVAISLFMLWVFGSVDEQNFHNTIKMSVVLGFPAGVGAAAARLII